MSASGTRGEVLDIAGATPRERGLCRGRLVGATVRERWPVHLRLFELAGHGPQAVRRLALASLDAADAWWAGVADEVDGIAEGARVERWQAAALQARTELLVAAGAGRECTIIGRTDPPMLAQVWDWHRELADAWHAQRVEGAALRFAGITEHGISAKIGRNEAGVGLVLAILSHAEDAPGRVPIHVVCHRVLAEAATTAEARAIIASAQLGSSSALGLVGRDGAAIVEASPAGVADAPDHGGWLLHANHFLAPTLADGSRTFRGDPDSHERQALLEERADARCGEEPASAAGLPSMLRTRPGEDPANICCVPRDDQPLGRAWQTLATVAVTPDELAVRPGSPVEELPALLVDRVGEGSPR